MAQLSLYINLPIGFLCVPRCIQARTEWFYYHTVKATEAEARLTLQLLLKAEHKHSLPLFCFWKENRQWHEAHPQRVWNYGRG